MNSLRTTMDAHPGLPPSIAVLGRIVLDIYVDSKPSVPTPGFETQCRLPFHVGGTAANTAVDLAALGVPVSLYGAVGSDPFGEWLIDEIRSRQVLTGGVRLLDQQPTSISLVFRDLAGESAFINQPGANECVTLDDIVSIAPNTSAIHIGGLMSLPGVEDGDSSSLRRLKNRAILSADTTRNLARAEKAKKLLPLLDFLFVNRREGEAMAQTADPREMLNALRSTGADCVIIKLGEEGCMTGDRSGTRVHRGFSVVACDSTGAGDAFVAGFLTGVVQGWDVDDCARLANAAGAAVVQSRGATEGIAQVWSFAPDLARRSGILDEPDRRR